jgi:branched-chain amino acid transport system permease protein
MNRRHYMILVSIALALALPIVPPLSERPDLLRWVVQGVVLAMFAVSFSVSAGLINLVNFGFAAFIGVGAYCSAIIADETGISPWITMWMSFVFGGAIGATTGAITLKLRGIYAAVIFWFLGLALEGLVTNLTGLTRGSSGYISQRLFDTASNLPYYYVALGLLAFGCLVFVAVNRSRAGLAFKALGDNVDAARASGVDILGYRSLNVTISCALAGLSGAFYAHFYGVLTPGVLSTAQSVMIMVPGYLGGRSSLGGVIAASLGVVILTNWLDAVTADMPGLDMIIYSILLLVAVVFMPKGLVGLRIRPASLPRRTRNASDRPVMRTSSTAKPACLSVNKQGQHR